MAARQGIPYSALANNQRLGWSQLARWAKLEWSGCFPGLRRAPASSGRTSSASTETPLPKHSVLSLGAKGLQAVRKLVKGLGELWVDMPEARNVLIGSLLYKRFEVSYAVNF